MLQKGIFNLPVWIKIFSFFPNVGLLCSGTNSVHAIPLKLVAKELLITTIQTSLPIWLYPLVAGVLQVVAARVSSSLGPMLSTAFSRPVHK